MVIVAAVPPRVSCAEIALYWCALRNAYARWRRSATMTPPALRIPMYTVTRSISFCYGHRLLAYEGPCMHLHGHNARAVITLEAQELDRRGMVVDFVDIKLAVKEWIDAELDHTMLLHEDDPFLAVMRGHGERVKAVPFNPTAENIARMIFERVQELGFPVIEVTLWETETSQATYRP